LRIIIGLAVGVLLGVTVPTLPGIGLMGDLFVGALKGIAPVLVFFLIMAAVSHYQKGSETHFGSVIVLYLTATLLSAFAAVGASYAFPVRLDLTKVAKTAASGPKDLGTVLTDLFNNAVTNPFQAVASGNYLAILFWALMIGFALRLTSVQTRQVITDLSEAITNVAQTVIQFAPFGIAGLVFKTVSTKGLAGIARYGQLVALLVGTMAFVYLV
ncbi:cation:dicarboxylate symporter family transporter, partial [Paenibacillus farraposensis]